MSIASLNPLYNFYQQPLPPIEAEQPESIVSQKTIHQWCVNEYIVYLINQDQCLWYITTDQNRKEIQTGKISTSGTRTLDEEIIRLKQSRVLINEDGTANFFLIYHTWRIPNRELDKLEEAIHSLENDFIKSFSNYHSWKYDPTTELSLNQGNEDIVWNIFRNFSKKDTSFYSLQETTVPSLRCHPGTIALIDKIKKEAFNNPQHVRCLIRDFKVRIIDSELIKKEYEAIKADLKEYEDALFFYETLIKVLEEKDKQTYGKIHSRLLEIFQECEKSFNIVNDAQVPRIMDLKNLKKDYEELRATLEKCKESLKLEKYIHEKKNAIVGSIGIFGIGAPAVYLAKEAIGGIANSVKNSLGNGIIGSLAGGCTKVIAGSTILFTGVFVTLLSTLPFFLKDSELDADKLDALQKRMVPLSLQKPLIIEIEPISEPSVFDPRVRVSKFTWAVTVITTEHFSKSHAALVIEGINDGFFNREACLSIGAEIEVGEKFIYLAEFNPPVEAYFLSPSQLKYEKRTEIWMKTSDKVQEIIQDIGKEVLKENPRRFNIRGKNAFLPNITYTKKKWVAFFELPGDNCYTFTKDHTKKLDIDPGSSPADFIAAIARIYTKHPESYKDLPVQQTI